MILSALGLCGNSVFLRIDHFHAPGETVTASGRYSEPGGKGFNQAVAAARLGAEVRFFTCVGDDGDGRMCLDFLRGEGVTPVAQTDPSASTAYACILTDAAGENRVTVYRGAAERLSPEFLRLHERELAQSDALLINHEYPAACNEEVMRIARAHGIPVICNPAPAVRVPLSFLRQCAWITPNRTEAAFLLGAEAGSLSSLVRRFREAGIDHAAVTLGSEGALLIERETALLFPAPETKAEDTTGAGDCFTAAFAVGLLSGLSARDAVRRAVAAAALSVSHAYVMPGLPAKEAVDEAEKHSAPPRSIG